MLTYELYVSFLWSVPVNGSDLTECNFSSGI